MVSDSPRGLPVKERLRLNSLRRAMSQSMMQAVQGAALSQVNREIDITSAQERRADLKVSLNTMMMAAVARTLTAHPLLNAELLDKEILIYDTVNLGMAVAVPDGLVVVVIPNVHQLTLAELDGAIRDRSERARSGKLTLADVEGGTFTVSNLGMYGIDGGFPIPRPPESAILLIGATQLKPAAFEGQVALREMVRLSLNFDHRFIDGATAAKFLQGLNDFLTDSMSWDRVL